MTLDDLLEEIRDDFEAEEVPATIVEGKSFVAREPSEAEATTGRIVVVPKGFFYGPPEADVAEDAGGNPRPVAARRQTLEVHVWGYAGAQADPDDQDTADNEFAFQLADQFWLSLYRSSANAKSAQGAPNDAPDLRQTLTFGAELVFTVEVGLPVLDTPWTTVTADDGLLGEHTGVMVFGATEVSGCSTAEEI
jgi:hypothetical protein